MAGGDRNRTWNDNINSSSYVGENVLTAINKLKDMFKQSYNQIFFQILLNFKYIYYLSYISKTYTHNMYIDKLSLLYKS